MKKKTNASYLKALEKRLLDAEKENQFLRLMAEASEIAIQIAEEDWAASAVQNSNPKKVWPLRRSEPDNRKADPSLPAVRYGAVD